MGQRAPPSAGKLRRRGQARSQAEQDRCGFAFELNVAGAFSFGQTALEEPSRASAVTLLEQDLGGVDVGASVFGIELAGPLIPFERAPFVAEVIVTQAER